MQILKFGEILRYFDINDFSYGAAKELHNLYDNYDITSSICNGILYNNKNKLVLNVKSEINEISTTENLNYIQVSLNRDVAQRSFLDKKLFFKCKVTSTNIIDKQYVLIVGDYNHVSWVLVEINNGKFEFYDNDSTNITSNVLVKTIDIPQNEWIDFEIYARFSEEEGFYRYDIKVNNELIQNISGNKKTASDYNDSCFDDGFVLYNVLNGNKNNNILFKDICMYRQYYIFIKKPIVTIAKELLDDKVVLTPTIEIDPQLEHIEGCSLDYTFSWNDNDNNLIKTIDEIDEEYKIYTLTVTDSLDQSSTACVLIENFKDYSNSIVKFGWSTTGEMKKQISFENDIVNYKTFNYIAQDIYGKIYYGSCFVDNYENSESLPYEITSYKWNTNEVTESIYVDVDETEYKEYYCTVTDNYGNKTTDSIIVDNFIPPYNEISSYTWDNLSHSQTRTVNKNNEYSVYKCTVTDLWGNSTTGAYILENFKELNENNKIVSYKWNTNEITRSIEVPYPEEQYKPYYCTVTDSYGNKTTDSTIVTKFKEPTEDNRIVSYVWNTNKTTNDITVSLDSFNTEYKVFSCVATDLYGSKVKESYIVEKPITRYSSCEITSYKWDTGETSQNINVDLNNINNFEVFSCTLTDNFNRTTTDSVILTNFKEPYNEIDSYKWDTGETSQNINVDLNNIENNRTHFCTATDIYNRKVTDSIIIDNFKEIDNNIDSYLWNTGETTQSITVDLDTVNEIETYFCTVNDKHNKSVTDSIIVDNFKEIENSFISYTWSTGETTQSITVDLEDVNEMSVFYCTGIDEYNKSVTDSIVVDNFKKITNVIVSYEWYNGETTQSIVVNKEYVSDYLSCWCIATDSYGKQVTDNYIIKTIEEPNIELSYIWNTGETTQSIEVTKPDDEFDIYYCTVNSLYGQTTDSIIVDNFKDVHYEIVSYLWSTGETTQEITLNLEDYPNPDIVTCTVTDDLGRTAEGFVVLTNAEPNFTYEWSNGATSKVISLRKNGVYTITVTSESGTKKSASIELEGLGDRPSVEVMAMPPCIEEGESLTLTAVGSDLDGTIVKYRWYKIEDDGTRTLIDEYDDSSQTITINNVTKNDNYIVQVEDDDGYIAESNLEIEFIDFSDILFYKYNGKTFMIPLHAIITDNSISVYKNGRNLYARYVEIDDIQASHIHVKINNEIKKLMKL